MNDYDKREDIKNMRRSERTLGYSRGMSGFGCSMVFAIFIFICTFGSRRGFDPQLMIIGLVLCIIFFIYNLFEYRFYKKNQMIKERGVVVKGFISDVKTRVSGSKKSKELKYMLIVEYTDPMSGNLVKYKTPILNFNPFRMLGSRECNVYIYKGDAYVCDFVKIEGSAAALHIEDFPELNEENTKRRFLISHIVDFMIPLVIVLIMFFICGFFLNQ